MEQNLNSLTNENLHLKSRIDKLENKLYHKITPTIPNNPQKCNDKGNHPKNNSNGNEDAQPKTESQTRHPPKRNGKTQILPERERDVFKTPKHKTACPFLHRGCYYLKKDQCDFLHHKFLGRKTLPKPKDSSQLYVASFLSHKKVKPYINPVPQPPEGNLKSWRPLPPPRPLMEIPIFHPFPSPHSFQYIPEPSPFPLTWHPLKPPIISN